MPMVWSHARLVPLSQPRPTDSRKKRDVRAAVNAPLIEYVRRWIKIEWQGELLNRIVTTIMSRAILMNGNQSA